MVWFLFLFMASYILIGLTVIARVKRHNLDVALLVPQSHNEEMSEQVRSLATTRERILSMPDGYEKVQAYQSWLKEVDHVLAQTKPTCSASQANIIYLNQLKR